MQQQETTISSSVIAEGQTLFEELRFVSEATEQESDHNLLSGNAKKLSQLARIDSIVIMGASGTGKSSAVTMCREIINETEDYAQLFTVPKRIITRPARANDNFVENLFANDHEQFMEMIKGGVHWQRILDKFTGRTEQYGFGPVPTNVVPIYSANNAFLEPASHLSGTSPDFFDHALIIRFWSYSWIREERLQQRSPDIMADQGEADVRMIGETVASLDNAHFIFRTRSVERERYLSKLFLRTLLHRVSELKEIRQPQKDC